ncbi:MAG TPA: BrnT family toxin [Gammaproteobacteria bacterium]
MMEFEFDPRKSERNLAKHGIDFIAAKQLWGDSKLLEVPARTEDESRFVVIGQVDGKHWSAVITYRGERIRIISVRRSRAEEVALHESQEI